MPTYDYKVIPAPQKGEKVKGVKSTEARFAFVIERLMNEMAGDGWEYVRAETLPSEERSGIAASVTVWRTLLIFRKPHEEDVAEFRPRLLETPRAKAANDPEPQPEPEPQVAEAAASESKNVYEIQPGPAPDKPPRLAPTRSDGSREEDVKELVSFLRSRSDEPKSE